MPSNSVANPPVNIKFSFDNENLDSFLHYKELEESIGTYYFNSTNTAFISLEQTMNEDGPVIELELVDPGAEFIRAFLARNVTGIGKSVATSGYSNIASTKIFLTYGIGDDPSFWAGPFICNIMGANYFFDSKGLETVNLTLVPSPQAVAESLSAKFNKDDSLYKFRFTDAVDWPIGTITFNSVGSPIVKINNPTEIISSLESMFRSALGKIGVPNVLFLTPSTAYSLFETINSNEYVAKTENGNNVLIDWDSAGLGYNPVISGYRKIVTLETVLQDLGLTIKNIIDLKSIQKGNKNTTDIEVDFQEEFKDSSNLVGLLKKFYRSLNTLTGTNHNFSLHWESNLNIVKALKQLSNRFSSFITNDTEPVLILGDTNLIKAAIYGFDSIEGFGKEAEHLADSDYLEFIRDYLNRKANTTNYFTQNVNSKEFQSELDIGSFGDSTKLQVIPYFEANTKEANILSFEADTSIMSFLALTKRINIDFEPLITRNIFIREWKTLSSAAGNTNSLTENSNITIDFEAMADELVGIVYADTDKIAEITSISDEATVALYARFYWDIAVRGFVNATIETTPMFNLSDMFLINEKCIVNMYKNSDPNQRFREEELYNTYYSGIYIIIGFKHSVDGRSAVSSFDLVKQSTPLKSLGTLAQKLTAKTITDED